MCIYVLKFNVNESFHTTISMAFSCRLSSAFNAIFVIFSTSVIILHSLKVFLLDTFYLSFYFQNALAAISSIFHSDSREVVMDRL